MQWNQDDNHSAWEILHRRKYLWWTVRWSIPNITDYNQHCLPTAEQKKKKRTTLKIIDTINFKVGSPTNPMRRTELLAVRMLILSLRFSATEGNHETAEFTTTTPGTATYDPQEFKYDIFKKNLDTKFAALETFTLFLISFPTIFCWRTKCYKYH